MEKFILTPLTIIFCCLAMSVYGQYTEDEQDDYYVEYRDEELPKFLVQPQKFSILTGDTVTLPCDNNNNDSKGAKYPLMFRYISQSGRDRMLYLGNQSLGKNPRLRKDRNKFILRDVRKTDAGSYICRFESTPLVKITHTLVVLYEPSIARISDEVQKVAQGSSVSLQCKAKGNPPPTITWSKKDGTLPSGQPTKEGLSITLEEVDRHYEGVYVCTASNGIGNNASVSMLVEVEYAPDITTEQSMKNTKNGFEATLVCHVHGRPQPSVTWLRGDSLVSSTKHIMTHNGNTKYSLRITRVSEDDFGEYTCRARNIYGETSKNITLTGLPKKPMITSKKLGGEKMSYNLIFKTETFSPIIQYRIKHRRVMNNQTKRPSSHWTDGLFSPMRTLRRKNGQIQKEQNLSNGGVVTMQYFFANLEPDEQYEVQVRIENRNGWSEFSDKFMFFTRRGSILEFFSEMAVGGLNGADSFSRLNNTRILWSLIALLLLKYFS